jgi:hypothetical protein
VDFGWRDFTLFHSQRMDRFVTAVSMAQILPLIRLCSDSRLLRLD